jgi:DNA-binding NarL/FixJ family response regulator
VRAVLHACYNFEDDLDGWTDRVHAALAPALDQGQGTLAAVVEFPEKGIRVGTLRRLGNAARVHQAVVRLSAFLAPQRLRESFFNGRVLGSSSGHYTDGDLSAFRARARGARSRDAAGWCVNDGVDHGFMVIAPSATPLAFPAQPGAVVRGLGLHISTGLRLQRVVSGAALDEASVEAIFDDKGTVQHVAGLARSRAHLERLQQEVLRRATRESEVGAASAFAAEALSAELSSAGSASAGAASGASGANAAAPGVWDAVVAGRWSLVDRFDSDARRFVIAYRNPPGVLDPRRLTPREEHVSTLAALGRSNKEIGDSLGISDSTVATQLSAALIKLGVESRALLPVFWRDLQGRALAIQGVDAGLIALWRQEDAEGLDGLTPAERSVAKGLLAGLSDKDIARDRNCSRRTIAKQAAAVYRKLGVRSRVELASKLATGAGPGGDAV